ncbi:MAG: hypothetical protein ACREDH_15750 [Methylocella sp.]
MASNIIFPGSSVATVGRTQNPALVVNPDTSLTEFSTGRHGQLHTSDIHGRYYAAASRGNLFVSSTLVAGVTVPAPAVTLASKAGMVNPVGSGVNMELVALGISSVTIEVALKNFALEFQLAASTTGGSPTSVTKLTANSSPLSVGGSTAKGYAYTAATMTNAAANTLILPLFGNYLTAIGATQTYFPFNGEIVMGPDTVMAITCVAALAAVQVVYIWSEWPV